MVEGFALTFPAEGGKITVEELEGIALGSSGVEICDKPGEPDAWIGCGMLRPVYLWKATVPLYFIYISGVQ